MSTWVYVMDGGYGCAQGWVCYPFHDDNLCQGHSPPLLSLFLSFLSFAIMLLLLLSILALAIVPFHPSEATFGQPKAGMILHADDSKTRSGLLSSDHSCVEYPSKFPAHTAQNVGNTHCGLWTDKNCTGSLYVVPAHYAINMPGDAYGSVIC